MSLIAKLAWPIQVVVFVLLLIFLPRGSYRLLVLSGYILVTVPLASYLRRTHG